MTDEKADSLAKLRAIEEQAAALVRELPPGLPSHRARLIESIAAHLALTRELEREAGRLQDAA
jgi:hypothetical protein